LNKTGDSVVRISSLAYTNIFEYLETVNVSFDNSKLFSSVGLALPALDFTSVYLVTALPISHFIPRAKDVYYIVHYSLYKISSFALGRSAASMTFGPSQPPTPSSIL